MNIYIYIYIYYLPLKYITYIYMSLFFGNITHPSLLENFRIQWPLNLFKQTISPFIPANPYLTLAQRLSYELNKRLVEGED